MPSIEVGYRFDGPVSGLEGLEEGMRVICRYSSNSVYEVGQEYELERSVASGNLVVISCGMKLTGGSGCWVVSYVPDYVKKANLTRFTNWTNWLEAKEKKEKTLEV